MSDTGWNIIHTSSSEANNKEVRQQWWSAGLGIYDTSQFCFMGTVIGEIHFQMLENKLMPQLDDVYKYVLRMGGNGVKYTLNRFCKWLYR